MNPALWISKTGLDAQQTDISVISNNLANASTVPYLKIYYIKTLTSQVAARRKTLKCRHA